jgi:dephospho-CoA kinase
MAFVLGLTGSFGSGKSTVAAMLAEAGAAVIDADEIARGLLGPGQPLVAEVAREFGPQMLDEAGLLRRRALAEQVFSDRRALARLNALVHPCVRQEELRQIEALRDHPLIVLDVPLLFEAGMRSLADLAVVVRIAERERFRRLRGRGFSEREIIARLGMQMPQSRKVELADRVIDNSGSYEQTRAQVGDLLRDLRQDHNVTL